MELLRYSASSISEWYHYINYEVADTRTNDWFIANTPLPITIITLAYLYLVLKWGPEYMKDKSPYSCRTFIVFYNVFQIQANAALVYAAIEAGWYRDYFLNCIDTPYSSTPQTLKIIKIAWYLIFLKLIDYIETVVFVLRKKQNQVSFLHLYHHVSTALLSWIFLKYFSSGEMLVLVVVNCSVHVIMYSYYLLSGMGPRIREKARRFKRMVTIIQILQFFFLITCMFNACPSVQIPASIMLTNVGINLLLFLHFYRKTYSAKIKRA